MKAKFRKYWEKLPTLFLLTLVVDPRFNLKDVKHIVFAISNKLTYGSWVTHGNLEKSLYKM